MNDDIKIWIGVAVSIITLVINGVVAIWVAKIMRKQDVIHKQIDGQQEALLTLTEKSSRAEGNKEGREQLKDESKKIIPK